MAIEKVEQILELIPKEKHETIKKDLDEYLSKLANSKQFGVDDFKAFSADPVNQPIVNSLYDKRLQVALDRFKEKFMEEQFPKLLDEEVKKRFPAKTQHEIDAAAMQDRIDELEKKIKNEKQINIAQSQMDGLFENIDPSIFIGESDEETINKVKKFKESALAWRDSAVSAKDKEWLEKTATNPQAGVGGVVKKYSESNMDERALYFKTHGKDKWEAWKRAG